MSIKALNWAFEHELTFQSSQRFVLVALANFSSETGKSYPQVATICRLTGLKDETVRGALKELVERGIISDTGKRAGPTQQVKVYQLPAEACELKTPENGGLQNKPQGKTPENGGLSKTSMKPGSSRIEPPPEDPAKTPENGGRTLTGNQKTGEGAAAPPSSKPAEGHPAPETVPPARVFSDGWCAAYKTKFKADYAYAAKDGVAAARLLKVVGPERMLKVAIRAWSQTDAKLAWACVNQSGDVPKFCAAFNQIQSELARVEENLNVSTRKKFVPRAFGNL